MCTASTGVGSQDAEGSGTRAGKAGGDTACMYDDAHASEK